MTIEDLKKKIDNHEYDGETRESHREMKEKFKADTLEAYGLVRNPKRDRVFDLAWEYGHGSGYREVLSYLEDFIGLVL